MSGEKKRFRWDAENGYIVEEGSPFITRLIGAQLEHRLNALTEERDYYKAKSDRDQEAFNQKMEENDALTRRVEELEVAFRKIANGIGDIEDKNVARDALAQRSEPCGIKVVVDPDMPENEVRVIGGPKPEQCAKIKLDEQRSEPAGGEVTDER